MDGLRIIEIARAARKNLTGVNPEQKLTDEAASYIGLTVFRALETELQKAKLSSELQVEFFYLKGDPAFICRVDGRATVGALSDIEAEMNNEMIDRNFPNGDGLYLFDAEHNAAQHGEYGRIELPAYWELELLEFRAHSNEP